MLHGDMVCFTSIDDAKLSRAENLVWEDLIHRVYILRKRRTIQFTCSQELNTHTKMRQIAKVTLGDFAPAAKGIEKRQRRSALNLHSFLLPAGGD